MRITLIIATASLMACTDFPDLDRRITDDARTASYPTLQPLDPVLARAQNLADKGAISPASVAAFDDRIAALRVRAGRLRGPVIDAATRARMRRGVAVPAAIR